MTRWRIRTTRGALDLRRFAGTVFYFSRFLRCHAGVLGLAFAATLVGILCSLAAPWPIQVVIDHVILGQGQQRRPTGWLADLAHRFGTRESLIIAACLAVVGIALLHAAADYASGLLRAGTAHHVANVLRRRLFRHMQTLSLRFHERNRSGDLLLRLTGDIAMIRDMLVDSLFELAQAFLLIGGFVFMMFRLSAPLALVAVATVPAIVLVSLLSSIKLRAAVKKAREKEGDLISMAGEVLAGIALVQAFTREDEEKDRLARLGRSSLRAGLKTVRLETRLARTVQLITALGTSAILYLGVLDVLDGRFSAGMLIVFLSYFTSLLKPIRNISKLCARMAKSSGCAERVREVLEAVPDIRDLPGAVPAPGFDGRLQFDNVDFSYEQGRPTLTDIRLDILPGQHVALVGPTGAGKSTLIKLLLRFYDPQEGAVRIDGRDIREFTVESLRRQISIVQQETILFGTTIAENIAMGRPHATMEDVRAAAAVLDLDEWLLSLPAGYDTRVGERGVTLSGGQRQLIALARAMLRGGRILIFDEPTTGLDGRTEARVRHALRRAMQGRTTILISHGARPLADVDRIIVVHQGRIAQDGPRERLSAEPGPFRELFPQAAATAAESES
jgi:ABC-type multidrug transport system fused ATPase/permease subunit